MSGTATYARDAIKRTHCRNGHFRTPLSFDPNTRACLDCARARRKLRSEAPTAGAAHTAGSLPHATPDVDQDAREAIGPLQSARSSSNTIPGHSPQEPDGGFPMALRRVQEVEPS